MDKIYVVTDLGPGDGGKGGIVHALVNNVGASVIIKRGGAQGSHGVRTSRGESFNFSQWGCGTFEGIPTYLSSQMVISPVGLHNESEALKRLGFYNPFTLLSCNPYCIVATPYHRIASQLEELLKKDSPRGTVGTGVGQAYRMRDELGESMTMRAFDLKDREQIIANLLLQLAYYRDKYAGITSADCLPQDVELLTKNLDLLYDGDFLSYCCELFADVGKKLYFKALDEVLKYNNNAVVECSHGVLTDAEEGLKPHVSAIRTLPKFATEMLRNAGYSGEIINYAVHRAYEIRHGAGPMPTYDPSFTTAMLPGSHKEENRWQGIVRAGPLDYNLLRYAVARCSGTKFDGICLTWFDQILAKGRVWSRCFNYENTPNDGELYTDFLKRAIPKIRDRRFKKPILASELISFMYDELYSELKIPLEILSIGPTEQDKVFCSKYLKEE